jgi:hypothetical protein
MKNIKLNKKKEFVLCDNNQAIKEPESIGVQLKENIFLFRKEDKYLIENHKISKNIELSGYVNFYQNYIVENNGLEFIFYDYDNLETNIKQTIGNDKYNIWRYNDYVLYEGVLYKSNERIADLTKTEHIVINSNKIFITNGLLIITYSSFPDHPAYLFCFNIGENINLNEVNDVRVNLFNDFNQFSLFKINNITSIFNYKGNLVFNGIIEKNNFNQGSPSFYYFKHNNQFYFLFEELIGSLDFIDGEFKEIYSSKEIFVLLNSNHIIIIDLLENKLKVIPSSIPNLSKNEDKALWGKSILRLSNQIIFLLTDGVLNYFYNPKTESIDRLESTYIQPHIYNKSVIYIDNTFKLKSLDIECESVIDYSYLEDDILLTLLINNEYHLISTKRGLIKKSEKPLNFEFNFGSLILIDPQPGKMVETLYYNESDGKIVKLPLKFNSIEVNKNRTNMKATFKGNIPYNKLLIHMGISPMI